ncbi:hypothetical protein NY08_524 [Rhodococcus sp. B7740]|nr:hypothetical protein NY08_524 [Rhodococcus sp. B7740]
MDRGPQSGPATHGLAGEHQDTNSHARQPNPRPPALDALVQLDRE